MEGQGGVIYHKTSPHHRTILLDNKANRHARNTIINHWFHEAFLEEERDKMIRREEGTIKCPFFTLLVPCRFAA